MKYIMEHGLNRSGCPHIAVMIGQCPHTRQQQPKQLVRVCDDSEGDETDAESDVDTAIHIRRLLNGGAFLHGLCLVLCRSARKERGVT